MPLIEPVECPSCHQRAFLGDPPLSGGGWSLPPGGKFPPTTEIIACACGHRFERPYEADQHIIGQQPFGRWQAASNHRETASLTVRVGEELVWKFSLPFDVIGASYFTPEGWFVRLMPEFASNGADARLVTSRPTVEYISAVELPALGQAVQFAALVYGLRDLASVPTWRQVFYSAMFHTQRGLLRPAFLDYETAFEAFVGDYLRSHLTRRFDVSLADYLLRRNYAIEGRVSHLMEQAVGFSLKDIGDLNRLWHTQVQQMRNLLTHGAGLNVTPDQVEQAHRVVYRIIRWIEDEPIRI